MKIIKCFATEKLKTGDPVCFVKKKWWQLKPRVRKAIKL